MTTEQIIAILSKYPKARVVVESEPSVFGYAITEVKGHRIDKDGKGNVTRVILSCHSIQPLEETNND